MAVATGTTKVPVTIATTTCVQLDPLTEILLPLTATGVGFMRLLVWFATEECCFRYSAAHYYLFSFDSVLPSFEKADCFCEGIGGFLAVALLFVHE